MKIRFTKDELESLTKVMLRELKRIGYNLNEVLKKANAIGLIDVPEMRKSVTEIRQAVKSIQDAYTVE